MSTRANSSSASYFETDESYVVKPSEVTGIESQGTVLDQAFSRSSEETLAVGSGENDIAMQTGLKSGRLREQRDETEPNFT